MAVVMSIKNSFITVAAGGETESKRSTSVPRSFKPPSTPSSTPASTISKQTPKLCWADMCPASDVSTKDSDDCSSIADQETYIGAFSSSNDSDGASTNGDVPPPPDPPSAERPSKTVLSLCDTITAEAGRQATKLNKQARLFEPISAFPLDMRLVMLAARAALCAVPQLSNVHMSEGSLGSTTTIVGSYTKGSLQSFELAKTLSAVKKAILDAAANSANTYVMGYAAQPFVNVGKSGFSAKLGAVPAMQEDATCWDTYQKGFCPRRSTCRWCHPLEGELAQVVVMLDEV